MRRSHPFSERSRGRRAFASPAKAAFYQHLQLPALELLDQVGGPVEWFGLSLYLAAPRFSAMPLPFANGGILGARDNVVWIRLCAIANDVFPLAGPDHIAHRTDQPVLNYVPPWLRDWDRAILTEHRTFTDDFPDSASPVRGLHHFPWAQGRGSTGRCAAASRCG